MSISLPFLGVEDEMGGGAIETAEVMSFYL